MFKKVLLFITTLTMGMSSLLFIPNSYAINDVQHFTYEYTHSGNENTGFITYNSFVDINLNQGDQISEVGRINYLVIKNLKKGITLVFDKQTYDYPLVDNDGYAFIDSKVLFKDDGEIDNIVLFYNKPILNKTRVVFVYPNGDKKVFDIQGSYYTSFKGKSTDLWVKTEDNNIIKFYLFKTSTYRYLATSITLDIFHTFGVPLFIYDNNIYTNACINYSLKDKSYSIIENCNEVRFFGQSDLQGPIFFVDNGNVLLFRNEIKTITDDIFDRYEEIYYLGSYGSSHAWVLKNKEQIVMYKTYEQGAQYHISPSILIQQGDFDTLHVHTFKGVFGNNATYFFFKNKDNNILKLVSYTPKEWNPKTDDYFVSRPEKYLVQGKKYDINLNNTSPYSFNTFEEIGKLKANILEKSTRHLKFSIPSSTVLTEEGKSWGYKLTNTIENSYLVDYYWVYNPDTDYQHHRPSVYMYWEDNTVSGYAPEDNIVGYVVVENAGDIDASISCSVRQNNVTFKSENYTIKAGTVKKIPVYNTKPIKKKPYLLTDAVKCDYEYGVFQQDVTYISGKLERMISPGDLSVHSEPIVKPEDLVKHPVKVNVSYSGNKPSVLIFESTIPVLAYNDFQQDKTASTIVTATTEKGMNEIEMVLMPTENYLAKGLIDDPDIKIKVYQLYGGEKVYIATIHIATLNIISFNMTGGVLNGPFHVNGNDKTVEDIEKETGSEHLGKPFIFKKYQRTYLPVRMVAYLLGTDISYNATTKVVSLKKGEHSVWYKISVEKQYEYSDRVIKEVFDKDKVMINELSLDLHLNKKVYKSDAPPIVIDGRTYLPIRAFAEVMYLSVGWNNQKKEVYLYSTITGEAEILP